PVAQVTTVTPATGTGEAIVRVVRADLGYQPHERVTSSVTITGKTKAEITDAFVTLINGDNQDFVTASKDGSDNLALTGAIGTSFETSTDELASTWTIAATTTPEPGTGTSAQVANLEEIAYGGNYINRIYLPITPPSYVVDGETYDLFTILVRTNTTPNISKSNKYLELRLAVQATASGIDLPEFFFGVVPSA
ncbi:MAG: hypothetical protein WD512_06790, partial [Candidatus Paceibacterota bacterium]